MFNLEIDSLLRFSIAIEFRLLMLFTEEILTLSAISSAFEIHSFCPLFIFVFTIFSSVFLDIFRFFFYLILERMSQLNANTTKPCKFQGVYEIWLGHQGAKRFKYHAL